MHQTMKRPVNFGVIAHMNGSYRQNFVPNESEVEIFSRYHTKI